MIQVFDAAELFRPLILTAHEGHASTCTPSENAPSTMSTPSLNPPSSNPPPASSTPKPQPSSPHRTAEARAAFTAHLTSIGTTHISALEQRATDIHTNTQSICKQETELEKQTKKLGDERKKQEKVVDEAGKKLKELGDIQNWAEVLERDLQVLEMAVGMGQGGSGWVTEEDGELSDEEGEEVEGGVMVNGGTDGEVKRKGKIEDEGKEVNVPHE